MSPTTNGRVEDNALFDAHALARLTDDELEDELIRRMLDVEERLHPKSAPEYFADPAFARASREQWRREAKDEDDW